MNGCCLTKLPPEILEKIFIFFSSDVTQLKHLYDTCRKFRDIILKVPLRVKIPLSEEQIAWIHRNCFTISSITNKEIAAFINYQITPLNLAKLKVANLVSFDYQSRKCEVTPHYWRLLSHLSRHS